MKRIFTYVKKYWHLYLIAIISMIISILLDLSAPLVINMIVDDVFVGGQLQLLMRLLISLLLIGLGRCIFAYTKEFLFDITSVSIGCHLRSNIFSHIQSLSLRFFNKNNTGELMARVKDDIDKIWGAIGFIGMLLIESVIHCVLAFYFMFRINPYLSLITLSLMPLVAYNAIKMEKKLGTVYDNISEENAALTTVVQENLAGVRTVKAFAREKHEMQKFLDHNENYYDLNMEQAKIVAKYRPNIQFITRLLLVLVLSVGGVFVIDGQITLGNLSAFIEYANNIMWPMEIIGWLVGELAAAVASNKKIDAIYNVAPEIISPENPIQKETINGKLEFRNVSFSIDDTKILEDINFTVDSGKTLGIMGSTGAGKSSIVNLIERFYDVDSGEILLDDENIKDYQLKQLRANTAIVMQDVILFSDTVEENLRIGNRDFMDRERMHQATEYASAKDFIENLSDQYDTIIGERGVGLSGGQKQRISIARAFAKNAPLLILDDSTSALDMETEHQIQDSLSKVAHKTKIIIAHRISAVRDADEIIILEHGKIAERGTHSELMQRKGLYHTTYETQYGTYSPKEVSITCP